jgi:hypothetical protein
MNPSTLNSNWLRNILFNAILATALLTRGALRVEAADSLYQLEIQNNMLLGKDGKETDATLANVVERLRELEVARSGNPPNIVLSPDLPEIQIANLKLASTTLIQELEAIRVASGERFTWSVGNAPQAGGFPVMDPASGLPSAVSGAPAEAESVPLYVLRPSEQSARPRLRVEAFSLANYFAPRLKPDDAAGNAAKIDREIAQLESIMRETLEIYRAMCQDGNAGPSPTLRFHRGANLLILMGQPEAVEVVAKVVAALPGVQRSGGDGMGLERYGVSNDFQGRAGGGQQSGTAGGAPGSYGR